MCQIGQFIHVQVHNYRAHTNMIWYAMVINLLRLHTPRNIIHDGTLAYTLTFTHLDGRSWWVWSKRQQWGQTVDPSSYIKN
jgi:hypothetical protein